MPDPLTRQANVDADLRQTMPLFMPPLQQKSTSQEAHDRASAKFSRREAQILQLLDERGAMPLFRLAELLGVPDHSISGRITALKDRDIIEVTGEKVKKPSTGCSCDILRRKRLSTDL